MAESSFKDDIVKKMETSNLVLDNTRKKNIETNKRSRDNLSDNEIDKRATKKPRQQINTEFVKKEDDNENSIKNRIIEMQHMDSEKQNIAKDEIESEQLLFEKSKTDDIINEQDKEPNHNKNAVSDTTNERRKSASRSEYSNEPEVVDGLELSVECASDNDSSEIEKDEGDEEKTMLRPKTIAVKHSPNDSELEVSASESEISDKHNNQITKNNDEKNTSLSISKDSESEGNSKNNENDNHNHNRISTKKNSSILEQMATKNLKKNVKKASGRRQKSDDKESDDDDDFEQSDDSDNDKWNSTKTSNREKKNETSEKEDYQQTKLVVRKEGVKKLQSTKRNQVLLKENAILSEDDEKSNNSDEDKSKKEEIKSGKMSNKPKNKTSDSYQSDDSNEAGNFEKSAKDDEKKRSKFEDKVAHMKKFISAAGIKVRKYDDLWSNCKTSKEKIDRIKELLEKNGIFGRPTLEKCRKAKAKREQEREIAELDPTNIISEVRVTRSKNAYTKRQSPTSLRLQVSPSCQQEIHTRIRYVVDSDSE